MIWYDCTLIIGYTTPLIEDVQIPSGNVPIPYPRRRLYIQVSEWLRQPSGSLSTRPVQKEDSVTYARRTTLLLRETRPLWGSPDPGTLAEIPTASNPTGCWQHNRLHIHTPYGHGLPLALD